MPNLTVDSHLIETAKVSLRSIFCFQKKKVSGSNSKQLNKVPFSVYVSIIIEKQYFFSNKIIIQMSSAAKCRS